MVGKSAIRRIGRERYLKQGFFSFRDCKLKRVRYSYLVFSLLVESESEDDLVGHFVFILSPILRVQPSDFPLTKHFLPIFLHSLLPTKVGLDFPLVQNIKIAPALLVVRVVFVSKWCQAKGRRPFSCIGQNRYCVVLVSAV